MAKKQTPKKAPTRARARGKTIVKTMDAKRAAAKTPAGNEHRTVIVTGRQAEDQAKITDPGSTLMSNAE